MTRNADTNPENLFASYEIPGASTINCRRDWQYFDDQGLYVFDCTIILFDNQFTMTDVGILMKRCFGTPTHIFRLKADQHIGDGVIDTGSFSTPLLSLRAIQNMSFRDDNAIEQTSTNQQLLMMWQEDRNDGRMATRLLVEQAQADRDRWMMMYHDSQRSEKEARELIQRGASSGFSGTRKALEFSADDEDSIVIPAGRKKGADEGGQRATKGRRGLSSRMPWSTKG
ncbi:hypothetical protein OG21DRAFT_1498177 [Imleria badia]|nr:hypothetical protein OG21DRAFT_1498177 [Imleria badia]